MRTAIIQLGPTPSIVQLGAAVGFALRPAPDDPAAPFPLVFQVEEADGTKVQKYVQPGTFYRRKGRTATSLAFAPGSGSAGDFYLLDLYEEGEEEHAQEHGRFSRVLFDSLIGAGAVIDSGPLDVSTMLHVSVVMDNSAGGAARGAQLRALSETGALLFQYNGTVNAATIQPYMLGAAIGGTTPQIGVVVPPRLRVIMAAGGAADGRLVVFGR